MMSDVSYLIQQIRNLADVWPSGFDPKNAAVARAALNHSVNEIEKHIAALEASQEETRRRCQQLILEGHCREDAVIWIEEALGVTKETDK